MSLEEPPHTRTVGLYLGATRGRSTEVAEEGKYEAGEEYLVES